MLSAVYISFINIGQHFHYILRPSSIFSEGAPVFQANKHTNTQLFDSSESASVTRKQNSSAIFCQFIKGNDCDAERNVPQTHINDACLAKLRQLEKPWACTAQWKQLFVMRFKQNHELCPPFALYSSK